MTLAIESLVFLALHYLVGPSMPKGRSDKSGGCLHRRAELRLRMPIILVTRTLLSQIKSFVMGNALCALDGFGEAFDTARCGREYGDAGHDNSPALALRHPSATTFQGHKKGHGRVVCTTSAVPSFAKTGVRRLLAPVHILTHKLTIGIKTLVVMDAQIAMDSIKLELKCQKETPSEPGV